VRAKGLDLGLGLEPRRVSGIGSGKGSGIEKRIRRRFRHRIRGRGGERGRVKETI
jgi:hypothetical protein